jgi:hypothetical protein
VGERLSRHRGLEQAVDTQPLRLELEPPDSAVAFEHGLHAHDLLVPEKCSRSGAVASSFTTFRAPFKAASGLRRSCANQIVNCFAFDKCTKTSDEDDAWQDGPDKSEKA